MSTYAQDGVDVHEGDSFSAFAGKICKSTYGFCPFVTVHDLSSGNFRGPRGYTLNVDRFPMLKDCIETLAPDGEGTKSVINAAAGNLRVAARNVFAMTGGDITKWGGKRTVFTSVLDTSSLGKEGDEVNLAFRELMLGLYDVALEQELVVLNGETAELGVCVGSENPRAKIKYNWAGVMAGLYHKQKMILGNTLAEGQVVMALHEPTLRSNGISSARKALQMQFSEQWWNYPGSLPFIQACAEPSTIYDRFLEAANGWTISHVIPMHLITHVTGGSIRSKLAEDMLFRLGLSADLHDLYEPPQIMKLCKEWRRMPDEDAYETWSCGQGALVVIDEDSVDSFTLLANDHGIRTKVCGRICQKPTPQVRIVSKFGSGKEIVYKAA